MTETTAPATNPVRTIAAAIGITVAAIVGFAHPAAAQDAEAETTTHICTFRGAEVQTQLAPVECAALESLWVALNGPDWYYPGDWVTGTDPCQGWFGVTCDDGHVQSIDFTYFNPGTGGGHLPAAIGDFEQLEYLILPWAGLTGAIPKEIEKLDHLIALDLGVNGFSSVPAIDGLDAIEVVRLEENRLRGDITAFAATLRDTAIDRAGEFGDDATHLRNRRGVELWFADGQDGNECLRATDDKVADWLDAVDPGWDSCGDAPLAFDRCDVDGIWISTTLPPAECAALIDFFHATNGTDWEITDGNGGFVTNNWLSGTPQCDWAGVVCTVNEEGVPHVTELVLPQSNLTGHLPNTIGDLAHLSSINLHENDIAGALPAELGTLGTATLLLHGNRFTGTVPATFERIDSEVNVLLHSNCFDAGATFRGVVIDQVRFDKCD